MIILVGRPNVGKSTLFNRLCGDKLAIASDIAGTTINRKDGICRWLGQEISVSDFIGLPIPKSTPQYKQIMAQVNKMLDKAEAFILVIDGRVGLLHDDIELLNLLRKTGKPFSIVVNKVDNDAQEIDLPADISAAHQISALHGRGITELLDFLLQFKNEEKGYPKFKLAIIGRQNVGKSTLFNQLLMEERSVVSDVAGTTLDSVEANLKIGNIESVFVDTAGVRKPGRIKEQLEREAVWKTVLNVMKASAVITIVDGDEGPTRQDIHLISLALKHKKPVLIIVNKWDLIDDTADLDKEQANLKAWRMIVKRFPSLRNFPIIPVSALTGWNKDLVVNWIKITQKNYIDGETRSF